MEDLKAHIDKSPQPPGGGKTTDLKEYKTVSQSHGLFEKDLRDAVSSLLPKKASDSSSIPHSELLPFLQNLCSQVSHLRVGRSTNWQENLTKTGEGVAGAV